LIAEAVAGLKTYRTRLDHAIEALEALEELQ